MALIRSRIIAASRRLFSSSSTTQPVQFVARELTDEHIARIGEKDSSMRQAYDRVPETFPAHSQPDGAPIDQHAAFRKRLLYRSKQRGWLEVDLLMGAWAENHLSKLSQDQLYEYERILNRETIDLYNYATAKEAVPEELQGPVMKSIIDFCSNSPLGRADPVAYEKAKRMYSN